MPNYPKNIIVHHSLVSRSKNSEQFDAINSYHKRLGWGKIGYHYLIEPDGKVKEGRGESEAGAHCKQNLMNYRSIGICLSGNFDIEEPTNPQKGQLANLIFRLQNKYNIPDKNILPHRHFATYKSCWGSKLPDDILGYLKLSGDDVSEWAKESWEKAESKGIMKNRPKDNITREELSVILDRLDLI